MHFPVLTSNQMKLGKIIPTLFYERSIQNISTFMTVRRSLERYILS